MPQPRPTLRTLAPLLVGALAVLVVAGCEKGPVVETPLPPVTFQLRNDAPTPLFLHQGCVLEVTVKSVTNPTLTLDVGDGGCFCSCEFECFGANNCGQCLNGALKIDSVSTATFSWTPMSITFESRGSVMCARIRAAPAGSYRIEVPVFPTEADATAKTNGRIASQTFILPAEAAVPVTLFTSP